MNQAPWKNIAQIIWENKTHFSDLLTEDRLRIRIQFFCVFVIFIVISAFMTAMNILTGWRLLMWQTLVFALANVLNLGLVLINSRTEMTARYLFAVEIILLFTTFLIFGEPQGFSAMWIPMLPACGLLLYRLKYGCIISVVQLALILFFCWCPWGRSFLQYHYTEAFLMRFPVLYIAFFFVGILFELIRDLTQKELVVMRSRFEVLSKHDPLTGLLNRLGFHAEMEGSRVLEDKTGCAFLLMDFDNFKSINDVYGHDGGDAALQQFSEFTQELIGDKGCICRWGGDEIAIFFYQLNGVQELCRKLLYQMREYDFHYQDKHFHNTVSIGLITIPPGTECTLTNLVIAADKNLYSCKSLGKNRLMISDFNQVINAASSEDILHTVIQ